MLTATPDPSGQRKTGGRLPYPTKSRGGPAPADGHATRRPYSVRQIGRQRRIAALPAEQANRNAASAKSGIALPSVVKSQPDTSVVAAIRAYSRTFQRTVRLRRAAGCTRAWAASTTSGQAPVVASAVANSAVTKSERVSAAQSTTQKTAPPPSSSRIVRRGPLPRAISRAATVPAILEPATPAVTSPIANGERPKWRASTTGASGNSSASAATRSRSGT